MAPSRTAWAFLTLAVSLLAVPFTCLALRATPWTGPTSTGEVISLALPLDAAAVATATILGSAGGLVGAWLAGCFASRVRGVEPSPR